MAREAAYQLPLNPRSGLVSRGRIWHPDATYPLWEVALELAGGTRGQNVGGTGFTRGEALMRAAGETVERHAWRATSSTAPQGKLSAGMGQADHWNDWVEGGLVPAGSSVEDFRVLPARRFDGNDKTWIPVGTLDGPGAARFDIHPSGCASGLGAGAAAARAYRELVDRDAYFLAWLGLSAVYEIPPELWRTMLPARAREHPVFAEESSQIHVGIMPVTHRHWFAVGLLSQTDPLAVACGLGEAGSVPAAVERAVRETVQVSRAVKVNRRVAEPGTADEAGDNRLQYVQSTAAHRAAQNFISSFLPLPENWSGGSATDWAALYDPRVEIDTHEVWVLDMSEEIPLPLRDAGWRVVRAVSADSMQFRWDGTMTHTWSSRRLSVFGLELSDPQVTHSAPHLLL